MRNDLTDITLVVDRSGSMADCKEDAQGGINTFIEEQKKAAGSALLTLVQFDTEYEFIHTGSPIAHVPAYALVPRGNTALLDAVGRSISEAGARLEKMPEDQRPGLVVFVIVTDGLENSSKEFTFSKVKEMIDHQRDTYNWQFTFIGADASVFDVGARMGVNDAAVAQYDAANPARAYRGSSDKLKGMREELTSGGIVKPMSYSDEEREKMLSK